MSHWNKIFSQIYSGSGLHSKSPSSVPQLSIPSTINTTGLCKTFFERNDRTNCTTLTQLYNQSLNACVFPDEWQLVNIIPVFKQDIKQCLENYRPMSLLRIISKDLERCVVVRLRDQLLQMLHRAYLYFRPTCVTNLPLLRFNILS